MILLLKFAVGNVLVLKNSKEISWEKTNDTGNKIKRRAYSSISLGKLMCGLSVLTTVKSDF